MTAEFSHYSGSSGLEVSASAGVDPGRVLPLDNISLGVQSTIALPDGFQYTDIIYCAELAELCNTATDFPKLSEESLYADHRSRRDKSGEILVGIGVCNEEQLVAYGLLAVGQNLTGKLFTLVVRPDVRGLRLSSAITDERIKWADHLRAQCIEVTLGPGNVARGHYLKKGFHEDGTPKRLLRRLGTLAQNES
jgi:GNAT superfamily N-acetyltransferase